jgi:C1A family cysteine protease
MTAVAQQPVSAAVSAGSKLFLLYSGGIITSNDCGSVLNHAILIVGYGSENGVLYWLVKNTWGPDWGEKGYFRVKRSTNN